MSRAVRAATLMLSLAAVAACNKTTKNYFTNGGGDVKPGNFPASPIAQNNLAPDGGGFTENDQTASVSQLQVVFNDPQPSSDGPKGSADRSAMVQLFWTQLITSHATNTNTFAPAGSPGTIQIGPNFQFFTVNVNLASLSLGTESQVPYPAQRNASFAATDARRASSTQAAAGFYAYDNIVFWNYTDVSLATPVPATNTGTVEAQVGTDPSGIPAASYILSELAVVPGPNGTAALAPTVNQQDVTLLGTAGRHNTTNSTEPGNANPIDTGEEFAVLSLLVNHGPNIVGPDEGPTSWTTTSARTSRPRRRRT